MIVMASAELEKYPSPEVDESELSEKESRDSRKELLDQHQEGEQEQQEEEEAAQANDNHDENPMEHLLKSHRKQRKDLQGQIQAMKKSASKGGDKKKRRNLLEEVADLERTLTQRQEGEIKELQKALGSQCTLSNGNTHENHTNTPNNNEHQNLSGHSHSNGKKISKAQKRRDKLAEKARLRLDAIEKQEEENKEGARQKEIEAIRDNLRSRDLALYDISSDGDCLFAGVRHQLISKQAREMSIQELREGATGILRQNREDYLPFLIAMDCASMNESDPMEHYCHVMESTSAWGGDMELRALSDLLETPIEIIQWQGAPIFFGTHFDKPPLVLTYHRHIYGLGAHYNSTVQM